MNDNLHISEAGANLIKAFENCLAPAGDGKYKAYVCPGGRLTIGWGHTNDHGRAFDSTTHWTRAECDATFREDMVTFEQVVKRTVTVSLSQCQFDALVSFAYNCGPGNLKTLVSRLNRGDYEATARAFHLYNRARGQVLRGLVRRRASEALLFQGIADADYDGKPDQVQPVAPSPDAVPDPHDLMPQVVERTPPPKMAIQSKSIWTSLTMMLTGVFTVFSQWFQSVRDIIIDPNVLLFLTTVFVVGGMFLAYDRKKKLDEDNV